MRITGSGTIEANVNPSANGALRGNDKASENDLCKIADSDLITAVVGEYTTFQVLNAVASGIQVMIDSFWWRANLPPTFLITDFSTALGNDGGVVVAQNPGGAVGITHWYWETNVAIQGNIMWEYLTTNNVDVAIAPWRFPILLEPGEGLCMIPNLVNNFCQMGVALREV